MLRNQRKVIIDSMIGKLKKQVAILMAILALGVPIMLPSATYAACTNLDQQFLNGASNSSGDQIGCGGGGVKSGISTIAKEAVNILSIIVGVAAVVMIIYAGFRYITSGGESGSVSSAKNALIYAIVGIIIVALAQIIVHWVFNTSSNIGTNAGGLSGFLRL